MTLSICFLGAGSINAKHVGILRRHHSSIKLSIASRSEQKAKSYLSKVDFSNRFVSYDSAINSDCDIIVIGTPPRMHFDLMRLSLDAGKKVVVEKPVFNSWNELKRFYGQYKDRLDHILVAENLHFDPFHQRTKKFLMQRHVGRPLFMELNRLGHNSNKGWRLDQSEMALGALHEGGVHWLRRMNDFASVFEDKPYQSIKSVRAFAPRESLTQVPHEDTMQVNVVYRSGLAATLRHSWGIPARTGLMDLSKILLERGAAYFDGRGIFGFTFEEKRRKFMLPKSLDFGGYRAMWAEFVGVLTENKQSDLRFEDILYDFALMNAAYRSVELDREVELEEIGFEKIDSDEAVQQAEA